MARVRIKVQELEFEEGGSTIWVQGNFGTVLRIKVKGAITSTACDTNPVSHLDLMASTENPVFCLSSSDSVGKPKKRKKAAK